MRCERGLLKAGALYGASIAIAREPYRGGASGLQPSLNNLGMSMALVSGLNGAVKMIHLAWLEACPEKKILNTVCKLRLHLNRHVILRALQVT